jgi:hypothetical protein
VWQIELDEQRVKDGHLFIHRITQLQRRLSDDELEDHALTIGEPYLLFNEEVGIGRK